MAGEDTPPGTVDGGAAELQGGAAGQLPEEAKPFYKILRKCQAQWIEDFYQVNVHNLRRAKLEKMVDKAEDIKEKLSDAMLEVEALELPRWDPGDSLLFKGIKKGFISFIREGEGLLRRYEIDDAAKEAQPPPDPSKLVKAARVTAHSEETLTELNDMLTTMKDLNAGRPNNEQEFLLHQEVVTETRSKVKSTLDDAKALISDATDAGLIDAAQKIDDAARSLRAEDKKAITDLMDQKSGFGILSGASRSQKSDVTPPKFSGDPAQLDYYSFIHEWDLYCGSKVMSEAERFRVLTRTCLTGPAFNVAKRFTKVAEVIDHLKKIYGNPRYLFNIKIEEFRRVGACQGTEVKKMEWCVDIRSRMSNLHELSEKHGLLDKLYHSSMVGEIQASMSYSLVKDFKEEVFKKDKTGNMSEKGYWDAMCSFLDTLITKFITLRSTTR